MIGPVPDILINHQDIKTSDASYLQPQQRADPTNGTWLHIWVEAAFVSILVVLSWYRCLPELKCECYLKNHSLDAVECDLDEMRLFGWSDE